MKNFIIKREDLYLFLLAFPFILIYSGIIGWRDVSSGGDFYRYWNHYDDLISGYYYKIRWDLGYELYARVLSYFSLRHEMFFHH